MKNLLLALFVWLSSSVFLYSQGTIRGKIVDNYGEDQIGATIVLKGNNTTATIADFNGNFSLNIPSGGPQVIRISFLGYQTIEDTIKLRKGEVLIQNYTMNIATEQIGEAVVYGRSNKAQDLYMQKVKMKSATSIDYISAETIKKTGDSQVEDAIKRVPGVSTVRGFVTVRGLADRYVKTTFNGARIPTLDPFTNNIKLDMFPTSLIDNIVVYKTQSPDLPGDWSGAYLSIETKDYPQKFMIHIKTSVGYNQQTSFKNVVSSEQSSTDWLGYDNGYRDIDHSKYSESSAQLSGYELFQGLGQEEYMKSLGISNNLDNISYLIDPNDVYFKLNMVEYGILAPGNFYDQTQVLEAYNQTKDPQGEIYQKAFTNYNTPASEFGKYLPTNNWKTIEKRAPLSFSQELSIGNQVNFLGRPLGILAGVRYASNTRSDANAVQKNYTYNAGNSLFLPYSDYKRSYTIESNEWSALLCTSYKLNPYHSISFLFMPNFKGENKARIDSGYSKRKEDEYNWDYTINHDQEYEERKQIIYQFESNHYFPSMGLLFNLRTSYTDGESSVPDSKRFTYGTSLSDTSYRAPDGSILYALPAGTLFRTFETIDEDILDVQLSGDLKISKKNDLIRKLKFGGAYLRNTRVSEQYAYELKVLDARLLRVKDPTSPINNESFNISSENGMLVMNNSYYSSGGDLKFNTGHNYITAGYFMLDYELYRKLRFSGGLRMEHTDILNDVTRFIDYPVNDPRREYKAYTNDPVKLEGIFNPVRVFSLDYIPSANFIYKLISNEKLSLNTRLSYSKSLARPSIREISLMWMYDYILGQYIVGNRDLKVTHIDNFDLRFESFFSTGDFVSLTIFHKQFTDHIEVVFDKLTTWANAESATASGIEIEGRKQLIKNISVSANLTLIKSHAYLILIDSAAKTTKKLDHAMFGQAPYLINGLIDYKSEKLGLSASFSYNVQGPRITLVSIDNAIPNVYELPLHKIDFKLSKTLGNHFSFEFKIRNLLNQSVTKAYYYNGSYSDYQYDSYAFGRDYILSISYTL